MCFIRDLDVLFLAATAVEDDGGQELLIEDIVLAAVPCYLVLDPCSCHFRWFLIARQRKDRGKTEVSIQGWDKFLGTIQF